MRKANKLGAAYVIVIGPDEQAARQVTIKNMMTGEEQRVDQIALVGLLK
jgi:histidyl-tRNA synthetase